MFTYRATVVRVVDGDTLDLSIDLGFRKSFTDRVRLYDIDCPERGQAKWDEARDFVMGEVPAGTAVIIESHHPRERDEQDSFGRWLVTLRKPKATLTLNELLINNKLAVRWVKR